MSYCKTRTLAEAILDAGERFARDGGNGLYHYEGGTYRRGEDFARGEVKRLSATTNINWSSHTAPR